MYTLMIVDLTLNTIFVVADIYTYGGNGEGAKCIFPFTFNDTEQTSCISGDGREKPWCAVTTNYTLDGEWGYCIGIRF